MLSKTLIEDLRARRHERMRLYNMAHSYFISPSELRIFGTIYGRKALYDGRVLAPSKVVINVILQIGRNSDVQTVTEFYLHQLTKRRNPSIISL